MGPYSPQVLLQRHRLAVTVGGLKQITDAAEYITPVIKRNGSECI